MNKEILNQFAKEVDEGLSSNPKRLSSKWFYDKKGDGLFVKIMNMPEYYLTDCEFEIFSEQTASIIEAFGVNGRTFDLFELGAGNGTKTIELLKGLNGQNFSYRPVDISSNAIANLESRISKELPDVEVQGIQGEYFSVLENLESPRSKVVLFLGSNIGNLLDDQANDFLKKLAAVVNPGDKVLLGVDLKKDKQVIMPAYNDSQGYTAEFNLNLLDRINHELGADFDRSNFIHDPEYDVEKGLAMSYLKSSDDQVVMIDYLNKKYTFKNGERIFMEVSRKYDDMAIEAITSNTSLSIVQKFYDRRRYFCDVILEKV